MKVLIVIGTRPEAIKMAPLYLELKKRPEMNPILVVTAQHRQMLDQVLALFQIQQDYDLNIMKDGQTLAQITTTILNRLNDVIQDEKPDIVLVHGDTTTTFAASLSAFYNQVRIGHVEAGLRTYNKYSPFPEEMNRQLTGVLADFHFAPTENAAKHLLDEMKKENTVFVTGNTAIDALRTTVCSEYQHELLSRIQANGNRMVMLTAHRRENLGEPMRNIFRAIRRLILKYEDIEVVYPVHLNPIIQELAREQLSDIDRIHLIEPLDVKDFHNYLANSHLILTDSGGIQEEAPYFGVPVLVLRDTTERPEGVEAGTLKLTGVSEDKIFYDADTLLSNANIYEKMSKASNPYGDGYASKRIVDILIQEYQNI